MQVAVEPTTVGPRSENAKIRKGKNGRGGGLEFRRRFTERGVSPYDQVEWEKRDAVITDEHGETIFAQHGVEFPKSWSMMATTIVASKYFHGSLDKGERESSVRQLVGRVADQIAAWGVKDGYFADQEAADTFRDELTFLLLNQFAAFNSPVWFNCGVEEHPQCSACFINSVEDTMDSILTLAKTEGMLFKWGSGTGTNLSTIRSSREQLSSGGRASGPVSFMKGYDSFAGVIRSGGKTRRAAKMVILNVDHPDILDFVDCKSREEQKAHALIEAGYDGSLNGEAYASIQYQNANHSVRVSDAFMRAVENDEDWSTRAITDGAPMDTMRARDLFRQIAESAHRCGDPGMQFDDTVNRWHTSKNSGRINASNPCSEYMYLDDSACNLASLNLMKFVSEGGDFDTGGFEHAVDVVLTGMEIIVGNASYPTPRIEENSHEYRPLGLGYANLGALLMHRGVPYDSDVGRSIAAALTSLMTGRAYHQSARIAGVTGPFQGYLGNEQPFLEVMRMHRDAATEIDAEGIPDEVLSRAQQVWDEAIVLGEEHGFRNGQASVLAPTGTIGLMMDCDTTGVEPDLSLIKHKKLSGGGIIRIVNQTVRSALERLGYEGETLQRIWDYVDEHGHVEGAPGLKEEHLPVFDCALEPFGGAAFHPPHGPRQDDARGPAVPFGRHLEDRQHAGGEHRRGHRGDLPRILEARPQGGCHLPGRQQAVAAAQPRRVGHRNGGRRRLRREGAPAAGARRHHPQVRHRRAQGVSHRRTARGRLSLRDLPAHGQGRLLRVRTDGRLRAGGLLQPPARGPAQGPGGQVLPHAL